MSDRPIIDIRHAAKSYGPLEVLKDISLQVQKGQIVAIIGLRNSSSFLRFFLEDDRSPLTGFRVTEWGILAVVGRPRRSGYPFSSAQNLLA